ARGRDHRTFHRRAVADGGPHEAVMRRLAIAIFLVFAASTAEALADESAPVTDGRAETVPDAVRVTLLKVGGTHAVQSVSGPTGAGQEGCSWTVVFSPELDDTAYG